MESENRYLIIEKETENDFYDRDIIGPDVDVYPLSEGFSADIATQIGESLKSKAEEGGANHASYTISYDYDDFANTTVHEEFDDEIDAVIEIGLETGAIEQDDDKFKITDDDLYTAVKEYIIDCCDNGLESSIEGGLECFPALGEDKEVVMSILKLAGGLTTEEGESRFQDTEIYSRTYENIDPKILIEIREDKESMLELVQTHYSFYGEFLMDITELKHDDDIIKTVLDSDPLSICEVPEPERATFSISLSAA